MNTAFAAIEFHTHGNVVMQASPPSSHSFLCLRDAVPPRPYAAQQQRRAERWLETRARASVMQIARARANLLKQPSAPLFVARLPLIIFAFFTIDILRRSSRHCRFRYFR